jgi:hypothetical protein
VTALPGIGAATRFAVTRSVGVTTGLARAALSRQSDRDALRTRAMDALPRLWDAALDTLLRTGLFERTVDRLLSEQVVERVVVLAVEHPATERITSSMLESPGFERVLVRIVDDPGFEQLVTRIVGTAGFERLVLRIVHSELFDQMLDRALASEQLDRVVTQIAESDEVHDALRQQSAGMADELTDELRSRTMAADAVLERIARAVIRRRPSQGGTGAAGAGTT